MQIKLPNYSLSRIWPLILGAVLSVVFYSLYLSDIFWMFFSCLFAGIAQLCSIITIVDEPDSEIVEIKDGVVDGTKIGFIAKVKEYKNYVIGICVLYMLMDSFVFWAPGYELSFSSILTLSVVVITVLLVFSLGSGVATDINAEKIFDSTYNKEFKRLQQEEERNNERQKREQERINRENYLKDKFGNSLIRHYYDFMVSEEKRFVIFDDKKEVPYECILGCSLEDNSTTTSTVTTKTTSNSVDSSSKTSTGNMVKRAIVGGVLTGGVGAVVGATTARKDIDIQMEHKTDTTTTSNVRHDYSIYVNLDSVLQPMYVFRIGNDTEKAYKVMGILNRIINKNK